MSYAACIYLFSCIAPRGHSMQVLKPCRKRLLRCVNALLRCDRTATSHSLSGFSVTLLTFYWHKNAKLANSKEWHSDSGVLSTVAQAFAISLLLFRLKTYYSVYDVQRANVSRRNTAWDTDVRTKSGTLFRISLLIVWEYKQRTLYGALPYYCAL